MVTVITGSSKGIGRATAFRFAKEGHHLALCARNISDLEILKKEILKFYPDVDIYIASVDVSKSDMIKQWGKDILAHFGQVDILINNAGVFLPGDLLVEGEGLLRTLIETNLYSAYDLTRIIAPTMVSNGSGHIINICSVASILALPQGGSYSISKYALRGFSTVLREELKDKGVKVTSVLPGATWSASWDGVDLPLERLMDAEDIADTIYNVTTLGPKAVVEEILIRPQLGDI
jgi:short-subunit dehydrogenase